MRNFFCIFCVTSGFDESIMESYTTRELVLAFNHESDAIRTCDVLRTLHPRSRYEVLMITAL